MNNWQFSSSNNVITNSASEEFINVHKGLPSENTRKRSLFLFLALFIGMAVLVSLIVFLIGFFDTVLAEFNVGSYIPDNFKRLIYLLFLIFEQVTYVSITSLSVCLLEGWIIKDQIKSKILPFIFLITFSSMIGGILAGLLACFLELIHEFLVNMDPFFGTKMVLFLISFTKGLLIGALAGGVIGFLVGYGNHIILKNSRKRKEWFFYSCLSWLAFCSIGWSLAFLVNNLLGSSFIGYGIGMFLILLLHGIGFISFLHLTPQVEFL